MAWNFAIVSYQNARRVSSAVVSLIDEQSENAEPVTLFESACAQSAPVCLSFDEGPTVVLAKFGIF
jgi:hypothetical protein